MAALAVRPGVRCSEIDTIVHEACMARGCYPSPLNYRNFPKSVCTSVNEVRAHGNCPYVPIARNMHVRNSQMTAILYGKSR